MNETIGAKGGQNDRKRSLLISKKVKEKLKEYQQEQKEKELLELEKKVKQQQRITFFKTLPIVTIGQIYTVLTEDKEKQKELALKEAIERIEQEKDEPLADIIWGGSISVLQENEALFDEYYSANENNIYDDFEMNCSDIYIQMFHEWAGKNGLNF
jgi:hypothetical protein